MLQRTTLPTISPILAQMSAADVRGKTQPETNREQSLVRKRTTPPHIRASKNFFQLVEKLLSFKLFDQTCSRNIIVADVVHPISGMDFFQDGDGKRFMIDLFNRCLTDRVRLEMFPTETTFYHTVPKAPRRKEDASHIRLCL